MLVNLNFKIFQGSDQHRVSLAEAPSTFGKMAKQGMSELQIKHIPLCGVWLGAIVQSSYKPYLIT